MQKRNAWLFLVLSICLFALVAIIYWYSDSNSTFKDADRNFALDSKHDVTRIELKGVEGDTVVLYTDEQGNWRLNNALYANEAAVMELRSVLERLTIRQPVSIAQSNRVEAMFAEHGVLVDVYIRTHRIRFGGIRLFPYECNTLSFIVGKDTPDDQSTYMRKTISQQAFKVGVPAYGNGVSVVFDPRPLEWRDPVVFNIIRENIESVSVKVFDAPEQSFVLRPSQEMGFNFYRFDQPSEQIAFDADTARVIRFLSSFSDIYYERLPDQEGEIIRKELMVEQPFMEISVQSKDGILTKIQTYARRAPDDILLPASGIDQDPNRFYIQMENGEYALAQYYVFNRILRPLSFFENKREHTSSD